MTAIDWWALGGTRHAFVAPSFRSLCGAVRWTAALARSADPLCEACLAQSYEPAEDRPTLTSRPLTPGQKSEVFRRRWRRQHGIR